MARGKSNTLHPMASFRKPTGAIYRIVQFHISKFLS